MYRIFLHLKMEDVKFITCSNPFCWYFSVLTNVVVGSWINTCCLYYCYCNCEQLNMSVSVSNRIVQLCPQLYIEMWDIIKYRDRFLCIRPRRSSIENFSNCWQKLSRSVGLHGEGLQITTITFSTILWTVKHSSTLATVHRFHRPNNGGKRYCVYLQSDGE